MGKKLSKNKGFSYFPFDVIDWLTSDDVGRMTTSERGVYITLLAVQWRDDGLPEDLRLCAKSCGLRYEVVHKWFESYPSLYKVVPNLHKLANPKLWNLAIEVGKLDAEPSVDIEEIENKRKLKRDYLVPPDGGENKKTKPRRISRDPHEGEWCDLYTQPNGNLWRPNIGNPECDHCLGVGYWQDGSVRDRISLGPCKECFTELGRWKQLVAEKWPDMPRLFYE